MQPLRGLGRVRGWPGPGWDWDKGRVSDLQGSTISTDSSTVIVLSTHPLFPRPLAAVTINNTATNMHRDCATSTV